ncbi:MAG: RNA polymerase sigma factor [Solirubrobacteraceae bacterium]
MRRVGSDPAAFEELYRRHVRRLTAYAATRCRRPDDVADLVATTFVAALESVERYDAARGGVLPWLIGIARHLSSDAARYAQREREALARVAGWRSLGHDEITELEVRIDAAREAEELDGALVRLHHRDRELLLLLGHVGLSPVEAAQALGISGTAFRIRLMRARRALRKAQSSLQQSASPNAEEVPT